MDRHVSRVHRLVRHLDYQKVNINAKSMAGLSLLIESFFPPSCLSCLKEDRTIEIRDGSVVVNKLPCYLR